MSFIICLWAPPIKVLVFDHCFGVSREIWSQTVADLEPECSEVNIGWIHWKLPSLLYETLTYIMYPCTHGPGISGFAHVIRDLTGYVQIVGMAKTNSRYVYVCMCLCVCVLLQNTGKLATWITVDYDWYKNRFLYRIIWETIQLTKLWVPLFTYSFQLLYVYGNVVFESW